MAHIQIISSQTGNVLFEGAPRYVGAYLKPGYLEFPEIGSPNPIPWHVGDYAVYTRTGKTYRLYRTPQMIEQGESFRYGASFLYENVQFFDDSKLLERCPFTDLVPGDNTIHFSTQNVVSFFGKPLNVAERIQACMEAQYGAGTWEVRVVTTTDTDLLEILNTEAEFSVTGGNCQQALDKVYEVWSGLGFVHTVENGVNVITIGASNVRTPENTTVPFAYGNGLVKVERSIVNADEIGTRLFAYGSMKNMDATYYRGLDIYHAESVDIEHLMIPLANWGITDGKPDARKAYIEDAAAIASLGLIPKAAYFDGSGDLPDIHPTIERMTIGEVYDAGGAGYIPNLSKWSRDQRVDEIVAVNNPSDSGAASDMGKKMSEDISSHLDAVSQSHQEGNMNDQIWSGTTTKNGRVVIKFGQNVQTFTMMSGWTNPVFTNFQLVVSALGAATYVPLTPVQTSTNTWTITLPESVTLENATAGTIRVHVFGYVFRAEGDTHDGDRTFTFATNNATTVDVGVEYTLDKTFTVRIPQIGFDISQYADLGNGKTISMKTGMCAGRDFEIKEVQYNSSLDAWDLTLYRSVDEDLNILFPNEDYEIAVGDQFVLLDIAMPDMYVTVASSRLLAAAQKLLADISVEQPFYAPQIDAKVVYNESRVLREGMWMHVQPAENEGVQLVSDDPADLLESLGLFLTSADTSRTDAYVLIDTITIDENGSYIPTYEVSLRERKGIEWTENIGKSSSSRSSVSVSQSSSEQASGTVTSVGLSVPAGMTVGGSPVTRSGILALGLAPGYIIPKESDIAGFFEISSALATLIQPKTAYDHLSAKDGLFFSGGDTSTPLPDLYVDVIQDSNNNNVRVLRTPLPFISGGDQIVTSGTPGGGGGGGGGGAAYLYELTDVYGSSVVLRADGTAKQAGDVLAYNSTRDKFVAQPVASSVVGKTGDVTASHVATALTNAGYKLTDTVYSHPTGGANTTISAESGKVLSAITVNNLGHVTSVSSKTLAAADIPNLPWSKITSGKPTTLSGYGITDGVKFTTTPPSNANIADNSNPTLYLINKDSVTTSNFTPGNYGMLANLSVGAGHIQFGSNTTQNEVYLRSYWGTLEQGWSSYPSWVKLYTSGNLTLATLAGSSAKGSTSLPIYYTGSALAAVTDLDLLGQASSHGYVKAKRFYLTSSVYFEYVDNSGNGYVKLNAPFLTSGDQIVNSGTPGGSGGGGASYLCELGDVLTDTNHTTVKQSDGSTNAAAGNIFAFNGTKWYALKLGTNLTLNTSGSQYTLDAATTYSAGTGISISGTTISLSSTYQTYATNGNTAYGWGNHANAGYAQASALGSYVLKAGDTMTGLLTIENDTAADTGEVRGGNIILSRGNSATANQSAGSITFYGRRRSGGWRNGVRIASEPSPGNTSYDRQDLVFYRSNVVTEPANPDWQIAMRISSQGQNYFYGLYTYSLYVDNTSSGAASAGIRFRTEGTVVGGIFVNSSNDLYFSAGSSSTGVKVLTASNYDGYALPLSAGSSYPLTGHLFLNEGLGIQAVGGVGLLVYHPTSGWSGITSTQWGLGSVNSQGVIRSNDNDLLHYKGGNSYSIWDASNSNLSTVDWAANKLTVAGTSTFNDTMYVENRKYMYWKDSGGTSRNVFGLNNTDSLLIGYGLTSVTGSVVAIYGETVRLNTGMTELVQADGATLMLAGTGVNTGGSKILFRSSNTSDQNGFKIEAEAAASSSNRGRLALNFFASNNTTSPYAPDWKRAMRISYNGNIMFGNTASGSEFYPTVYSYGPLQVGTSTTNKNLTVYGSITSSGDQVISSDATKKKNWRDLKYGVADIARATAGVFDWKDGKGESAGTKAQDWMHLVPQLVHGEEGHMTLAYGQIAMLNTILLARRSEDHESRIKALELENAELRKEIERLRS